jgi:hypothetical protein
VFENLRLRGVVLEKGTPMGMPPGWTCLSLVHNAVCEVVDHHRLYRLKGDDLIAIWDKEEIALYKRLCLHVGLIVNDKSVLSRSYGTFCEGDYRRVDYDTKSGCCSKLVRMPTFSVRAAAEGNPTSYKDWETLLKRGVAKDHYRRFFAQAFRDNLKIARDRGVDGFMPTHLGGLGWAPMGPERVKMQSYKKFLRAALSGGVTTSVNPSDKTGTLATAVAKSFSAVRWGDPNNMPKIDSMTADSALATYNQLFPRILTEMSWRDAVTGKTRAQPPNPRFIDSVKEARKLVRKYRKITLRQPRVEGHMTYKHAYDVVDRLRPYSSDILARFSTWKECERLESTASAIRASEDPQITDSDSETSSTSGTD